MSEIVLDKVSKRFGRVRAVDAISFRADAGKFVVLLGPSGDVAGGDAPVDWGVVSAGTLMAVAPLSSRSCSFSASSCNRSCGRG